MPPHPSPRNRGSAPGPKPPLSSRLLRATWRGLPAKRYDAGWEPGLAVPGADGSTLRTDHYFPRVRKGSPHQEGDFPTLLVRSPYGRGLPWSPLYGILFAEQGFHVVLQSCRGTAGSGGEFRLWRHEAADGAATVAWLREQPWFTGTLGTIGPSYLAYTQWALALDPPPELRAMVIQVGLHDPHAFFHASGVAHLENALISGVGMTYQHRGTAPFLRALLRLRRRLRTIADTSPRHGACAAALGPDMRWLDDALAQTSPGDPYWRGTDAGGAADRLGVPTALITGWHDALADQTLGQYARLRRAGCEAALLVGPWTHTSALGQGLPEVFAESLGWLRAHLCGDGDGLRPSAVRVHVGGAESWRDLAEWPPSPTTSSWYPTPDGHLTRQAPTSPGPPVSLRHDPADPTPSVGGPLLSQGAGPRDNRRLEAREDVLTFTGPPLAEPLDLLGPVSARLRISADTEHATDSGHTADSGHAVVFVRLCDVDARGRSRNICDGPAPLRTSGQAPAEVTVPMSATAYRFAAGHRVRLQVSGGAHPRYAPGPGTTPPAPVRLTLHTGSVLTLPHAEAEIGAQADAEVEAGADAVRTGAPHDAS